MPVDKNKKIVVANNITTFYIEIYKKRGTKMKSIRLNIEGLELQETQDKINNQLENIVGVTDINLSTGQSYVDINYDDQTSDIEINNHLQNNGYKVRDWQHSQSRTVM